MGYRFGKGHRSVKHLLFRDDLKLYGRSDSELEKLINIVQVFLKDIGTKCRLDERAILVLKHG